MPMTAKEDMNAAALHIGGVSKSFGGANVVNAVSIDVTPGTILSLLGPSGCGKTTILRMIAGFLRPDSGRILIAGEDVTDVPSHRRKLGMVFQNYSLFPHMTIVENVMFGLKMQGVARETARRQVDDALTMVRMSGMENRRPAELSGGQQQRVALARAVVTRPRLLLLDEPFGALDRNLREEMQVEVKQLQRELGITFVFVTHDQEEALTLSDRIAVMRAGEIQQYGTPAEIYEAPATHFVAAFFGSLNTLTVQVLRQEGASCVVDAAGRQFGVMAKGVAGMRAEFAIRVSDVRLSATPPALNFASLPGVLADTIYKGQNVLCRVRLANGQIFTATGVPASAGLIAPGSAVHLTWPPDKGFLFPSPDNKPQQEIRE
jgi:spermidine/putrescine ABC transporter ATP-binding subunit